MLNKRNFDVVILGGGIAGLWLLNRLCNTGYNAILLESRALGSDQTMASQGMIHGGMKYTLGGGFTRASEYAAAMPEHWQQCLEGKGDVNLSTARVLSEDFYLWSTSDVKSKMGSFLASKLTRGRVESVTEPNLPALFNHQEFKGRLYRLADKVVDTESVVKALAENVSDRLFKIEWQNSEWLLTGGVRSLRIDTMCLQAPAFVFTAGLGNEMLLSQVGATAPQSQRRPLQQVMVKHDAQERFYGHCIALDKTPRLTISSHPCPDGTQVWYLGGELAEQGATMSPDALIDKAKKELETLLPWMSFRHAKWATLKIDRAEPRQNKSTRPDDAFACWAEGDHCTNIIAAWPTKLALSPRLANKIETLLKDKNILPGKMTPANLALPKPVVSPFPWQEAFHNDAG